MVQCTQCISGEWILDHRENFLLPEGCLPKLLEIAEDFYHQGHNVKLVLQPSVKSGGGDAVFKLQQPLRQATSLNTFQYVE